MIVRQFLLWARSAPPGDRAEAVSALARAYLYADLGEADRREAETALTAMLDDRSGLVRRAMAEALAGSPHAPRHIVVALACDGSEVADPVLRRSPILIDADLVDCAALGDARAQVAIASRRPLSTSVAGALAEVAGPEALAALAANLEAEIGRTSLMRMVERHGADPDVREALLARPDLPAAVAQAVAATLAESLGRLAVAGGWLSPERAERVTRDARDRTAVALSADASADEVVALVRYVRTTGQLTPALILRALLSRNLTFAAAAFADLSGVAPERVGPILLDRRGSAFRALYDRAGLPPGLRAAFEGALAASRGSPAEEPRTGLSRTVVQRSLDACEDLAPDRAGRLLALLRRFETEAALDEARRVAGGLADQAALAIVLEHRPDALLAPPEDYSEAA